MRAFTLLLCPGLLSAVVITEGYLTSTGAVSSGTWRFISPGAPAFDLEGNHTGNFHSGWTGRAGESISLLGFITEASLTGHTGTIDGIFYTNFNMGDAITNYNSFFNFTAPSLLAAEGTFEVPFAMTGRLSARVTPSPFPPGPNDCLVCNLPVTGAGIVTVVIRATGRPSDPLLVESLTYVFQTPEPATGPVAGAVLLVFFACIPLWRHTARYRSSA